MKAENSCCSVVGMRWGTAKGSKSFARWTSLVRMSQGDKSMSKHTPGDWRTNGVTVFQDNPQGS